MKNKNFAVIFILVLLIISSSILLQAQQPPYPHKWVTKKILKEQSVRRDQISNKTNVSLNPPHHQSVNDDLTILNAIIPDFQVNENAGSNGADQRSCSISTDGSGNFVIVWCDYRNGDSDIYAQRYSSDGSVLGTNFKVNDDQGSAWQSFPSISTDVSGNFVMTWHDDRNGDFDIYGQRYSSAGSVLGTNFKVNDDQGSAWQYYPSISTDGSGNFVITWSDWRNGYYSDIYGQRYSSAGSVLGTNFKVNDDQGGAAQFSPSISSDISGNFVMTWQDLRNGDPDIYGQRYSSAGSVLGANFKVNDDQGSAAQFSPSISSDGSGNFVITWHDYRNGDTGIYAQRHSSDGSVLGTNFKVNDDQGSAGQGSPSISSDISGNFVMTWQDWRNGDPDIYGQRYSSAGSVLDSNFRVANTSEKSQRMPDVKLLNGRLYNTWTDNRTGGTGYDIWANVLDWENPTGIYENLSQVPTAFMLSQNYPNPFNSSTEISYSLTKSCFVLLIIYDMLGNEIHTLENKFQDAGTYSINFNASALPSGIYFYRIRAGEFMDTKKFILQR